MPAKPTIAEIAQQAGVGSATVERVLNGRGGVRPQTVEKVILAAKALGAKRILPAMHHGVMRIEVLMVRPDTLFFRRLAQAFARIAATLDVSVSLHRSFTTEASPSEYVRRLNAPEFRRAGLILVAPDYPEIRESVKKLEAGGLPIVHVVTRGEGFSGDYVGINNYAAGRSAAWYIDKAAPRKGEIIAISHSDIYQVHRERRRGLSDYFDETYGQNTPEIRYIFGRDDAELTEKELLRALNETSNIRAIYNAGGGNEGVLHALKGRKDIFFVGHELTDETKEALWAGVMDVVFDQAPEAQARRALDLILYRLGLLDKPVENPPIRFITITAQSI